MLDLNDVEKIHRCVAELLSDSVMETTHRRFLTEIEYTEYIATEVYQSSTNPNIRDCVRISKLANTEHDVLRILMVIKKGCRR